MTPNNRRTTPFLIAAAAALALSGSSLQASLAERATFEEKVDNASGIVLGKVARTRSQWDASGKSILTYATFTVEKSLKGDPAQEVTVVVPGGHVGNINQSSVGIPQFNEGDERVVFLRQTKLGPTVLYFDQGTYRVEADSEGHRVIAPIASDVVRVDTQRGMAVTTSDEQPRTLEQFEREIQTAIKTRPQRVEMNAVSRREAHPSNGAIADFFVRNRVLLAIAALGAALATWQLVRSR